MVSRGLVSNPFFIAITVSFIISLVSFGFVRYMFGSYDDALKRKNVLISSKYWVAYFVLLAGGTSVAVFLSNGMRTGEDMGEILFVGYAAYALGLYFYLTGFREYRKYSLVSGTPTSKIRSVAAGTVEIEGDAVGTEAEVDGKASEVQDDTRKNPDSTSGFVNETETRNERGLSQPGGSDGPLLTSPFSGENCVVYKYEIEKYVRSGDDSHWETVDKGRSDERFYVDDGTGKILIDPRKAEVRVPSDNQITVDKDETPPKEIRNFTGTNVEEDSGFEIFDTEHKKRYTEYYISAGDQVYVFGKAVPRSQSSSDNPENLVITKGEDLPMLISDSSEESFADNLQGSYFLRLLGGGAVAILGFAVILWILRVI